MILICWLLVHFSGADPVKLVERLEKTPETAELFLLTQEFRIRNVSLKDGENAVEPEVIPPRVPR